jgi:uncharacterized protein YbjT (DUF2867 family)
MRIAVAGGTGVAGRPTVAALPRAGHDVLVLSRARGVDVSSGTGLDAVLAGVETVIDVTAVQGADAEATRTLFATATRHLLAAEQRTRVRHHVLLSIVGVDRIDGNAHYAGKRVQEELVASGPVPFTIQRATQFYEFAGTVVGWTRKGSVAALPPLLVQPVAAFDVGDVLAEVAAGRPQERATDLAGPEPQDLIDMARRTLAARGESIHLVPSWRTGVFGVEAAGEMLLPGPDARVAPTTFDAWLAMQRTPGSHPPAISGEKDIRQCSTWSSNTSTPGRRRRSIAASVSADASSRPASSTWTAGWTSTTSAASSSCARKIGRCSTPGRRAGATSSTSRSFPSAPPPKPRVSSPTRADAYARQWASV